MSVSVSNYLEVLIKLNWPLIENKDLPLNTTKTTNNN
jgi:hypothetical protein